MVAKVLDYSAGFPGAAAIKAAGYIGAVRYIGFPDRRKCTTAAELADFTRHGLGMALVYEDHTRDWLGGWSQGRDAAERARRHATSIGFPRDRPIYMAVDRDVVTNDEFITMNAYLGGAAHVLGGPAMTGVYGEHDVCVRAARAGVASWFWQCRAWSGTPPKLFAHRHLYQRVGTTRVGGVDCDINDVLQPDWGQHTTREDDVSKADVIAGLEEFFYRKIVNPREDAKPGTVTTLYTQIQHLDWRHVRMVRAVQDMIRPLYDDEETAAAAFARLDEKLAEVQDPISPAEHAAALAATLPAAVVSALREILNDPAPAP